MIDRICQYSVIILVGNLVVLQIVAIATDYWEYRGFNKSAVVTKVKESNRTMIIHPIDTKSYFSIQHLLNDNAHFNLLNDYIGNDTTYQPPGLIRRYYKNNVISVNSTTVNGLLEYADQVYLYEQYGNLFRDCDNLEGSVRLRLGITELRSDRCHHFITGGRNDDYVSREVPVIIHLERIAFALALFSIVSIVASLIAGMYGSLSKDERAMVTASSTALASGVSLTTSIALFHVKCHLLKRREFMQGLNVPFKAFIDESRIYSYGWSFVLAWICVVLCFVSAWTWLHKSQDIKLKYRPRKQVQSTSRLYETHKDSDYV